LKNTDIADKLFKEGALPEPAYRKLISIYSEKLFSVGLELKIILYAGILLLSSGLGILVYKNIDSIGHLAVISFIAFVSMGCFAYCYVKHIPYSNQKVNSVNVFADYILLLGCLTFATFMGYLQYQYSAFGLHKEIAFLIPALVFFIMAYYFDHIGVLSMAITALAGFVGIAITPTELLSHNDFSSHRIILSGLGLGAAIVGAALILNRKNIKRHFTFTYLNFSIHLLFISCLSGLFIFNAWYGFISLFALFAFLVMRHAYKVKSFYFLLFTVIYVYICVSYIFFKLLVIPFLPDAMGSLIDLVLLYFIASSVSVVLFLRSVNKKFKPHADI